MQPTTTKELLNMLALQGGLSTPLSDYALAARLGVSKQQMSKYRNGEDFPGEETCVKISSLECCQNNTPGGIMGLPLDDWLAFSDGVSERALLRVLGVHRTTLKRWRAGSARIPRAARVLIGIYYRGELPPRGKLWRGWAIGHDGLLYAPNLTRGFSPADLYELHWLRQARPWREAQARAVVSTARP